MFVKRLESCVRRQIAVNVDYNICKHKNKLEKNLEIPHITELFHNCWGGPTNNNKRIVANMVQCNICHYNLIYITI